MARPPLSLHSLLLLLLPAALACFIPAASGGEADTVADEQPAIQSAPAKAALEEPPVDDALLRFDARLEKTQPAPEAAADTPAFFQEPATNLHGEVERMRQEHAMIQMEAKARVPGTSEVEALKVALGDAPGNERAGAGWLPWLAFALVLAGSVFFLATAARRSSQHGPPPGAGHGGERRRRRRRHHDGAGHGGRGREHGSRH